ncbi:GNAT family N-acetyltransferase [Streptomyces sp. NPDC047108]|uniref:GNAT family N-acetyltransferase n=1 Tax=Streptomyces sp. NPDC047108 TaxID=3155025 RepID=UPI0033F728BA
MTTTLRPTGPDRHGADGMRSRDYEVCVNGRRVGTTGLSTDGRFGPAVGRIVDLRIEVPDRRRGRATVAALAAEEVLRGWGCRRVEATIPESAEVALRLAAALGYIERNRNMVKRVPDRPSPLPDGSAVRPMTAGEFGVWSANARRTYAQSWIDRGMAEEEARAKAEADHAALLPDGIDTAAALLRVLSHGGEDVGTLWVSLADTLPGDMDGFVFEVEVAERHRGNGHGRSLMLAAEQECRVAGADRLGLNVFAGNTPALRLYASLGYATTRRHLWKSLI